MGWFHRRHNTQPPRLFRVGRTDRDGHDLTGTPLAVIDFETSGLDARRNRIIEVAVVRLVDGVIVDEWSTLVRPRRGGAGPTEVHQLHTPMLAGAPRFAEVVDELVRRLDGCVVVAHNATFEESFLARELRRAGLHLPPMPALDTLRLARFSVEAPDYRLGTLCEQYGIELVGAHTALGDARATAHLAHVLQRLAEPVRYPVGVTPLVVEHRPRWWQRRHRPAAKAAVPRPGPT